MGLEIRKVCWRVVRHGSSLDKWSWSNTASTSNKTRQLCLVAEESLCKWIVFNFQLDQLCVLVAAHSDEGSVGQRKTNLLHVVLSLLDHHLKGVLVHSV